MYLIVLSHKLHSPSKRTIFSFILTKGTNLLKLRFIIAEIQLYLNRFLELILVKLLTQLIFKIFFVGKNRAILILGGLKKN